MKVAQLLLVLLATCQLAAADFDVADRSGNNMLRACKQALARAGTDEGLYCRTWVMGFVDGILAHDAMLDAVGTTRIWKFCFPSGFTYDQVTRVLVKHLEDHPKELHKDIRTLAWSAFQDAYPCETR
jgi:hypothetical protein